MTQPWTIREAADALRSAEAAARNRATTGPSRLCVSVERLWPSDAVDECARCAHQRWRHREDRIGATSSTPPGCGDGHNRGSRRVDEPHDGVWSDSFHARRNRGLVDSSAAYSCMEQYGMAVGHAYQQLTDWHLRKPPPQRLRRQLMRSGFFEKPVQVPFIVGE